jgi:Flp pilus assembly secretin CpaC
VNFLPPSIVPWPHRPSLRLAAIAGAFVFGVASAHAQVPGDTITRIDLPIGRSYPITTVDPITRVSVANPDIADAVVVGDRDVVINAKTNGETDIILWITNEPRRHYRIEVRSPPDRQAVLLQVRVAEVRKDALTELGVNMLYRDGNVRAGTGIFNTDNVFDKTTGDVTLPSTARFATVLSDFGTKNFLAFIDAQATKGRAKLLAEPNLLAGNRDTASFLEGGEFPVPIAQPGANGTVTLTVQYREFGIRLAFMPEIVSDSLIKLRVNPEVSDLDFVNGVVLSGFRIPALRTRRTSTTVDVKRNESLIISGMFSETRQRTRSGVPLLMDIPIIGALFGTTSWTTNETELLILVTPTLVNPNAPPSRSILNIVPDTTLPAREAIEKRLPPPLPPRKP